MANVEEMYSVYFMKKTEPSEPKSQALAVKRSELTSFPDNRNLTPETNLEHYRCANVCRLKTK